MFLSVIIPLYNNKLYLRDCVESLYKQDVEDSCFEVIIIDDGSTDGSENIAEKLALEHDNIKVLHQENQGPGVARNTGMAVAKGDYIHFVDADDFLLFGSYKYIFENFLKYDADIFYFSYKKDGHFGDFITEGSVTYIGDVKEYIRNHPMSVLMWRKIIKRSFIDECKLTWESMCYSSDTVFNWNMFSRKATILVCSSKIYSYRINRCSVVHFCDVDHVKKTIESSVLVNQKLKELSVNYVDCPAVKNNFNHKYMILFNRILCVPYSYREVSLLFAKCSTIGIEHLCQSRTFKLYDFLYRHPRLYFVFQPLIRFLYFKTHNISAETDDFIARKLKK